MVKSSNKYKNKMVPQVMPTISVAPSINNDAKNANDATQAHNNQPGAAKSNKKVSSKRKGKRSSKKHNANANAKDDKKLKLPTPTDKPEATLDQANDYERLLVI